MACDWARRRDSIRRCTLVQELVIRKLSSMFSTIRTNFGLGIGEEDDDFRSVTVFQLVPSLERQVLRRGR